MNGLIEKLKKGVSVDLNWVAVNGRNIGYRIWVDAKDNAVFTELEDGVNDYVIPLSNEDEILKVVDKLTKQGYGA